MKVLVTEVILNGIVCGLPDKNIIIDIVGDVEYVEYSRYETVVKIDTAPLNQIIKNTPFKLPLTVFIIGTNVGKFALCDGEWRYM